MLLDHHCKERREKEEKSEDLWKINPRKRRKREKRLLEESGDTSSNFK